MKRFSPFIVIGAIVLLAMLLIPTKVVATDYVNWEDTVTVDTVVVCSLGREVLELHIEVVDSADLDTVSFYTDADRQQLGSKYMRNGVYTGTVISRKLYGPAPVTYIPGSKNYIRLYRLVDYDSTGVTVITFTTWFANVTDSSVTIRMYGIVKD